MTALSANANYVEKEGNIIAYPIADNILIYKNSLVCVNGSGYAVVGAAGAGLTFVGVAMEKVDNTITGHAAGLFNVRVRHGRRYRLTSSGLTQASVGLPAYLADSGSFTLTPNAQPIGVIVEYVSATEAFVYVPDPAVLRGTGFRQVAGQATTVAASDTIVTGLRTVIGVVATLNDDPVAGCQFVTASVGDQAGTPAAGSFLLKTWKSTAAGDTAQIAATTFGKKVNYIAFGY